MRTSLFAAAAASLFFALSASASASAAEADTAKPATRIEAARNDLRDPFAAGKTLEAKAPAQTELIDPFAKPAATADTNAKASAEPLSVEKNDLVKPF